MALAFGELVRAQEGHTAGGANEPSAAHSVSGVLLDPSGAAISRSSITLRRDTESIGQTNTDAAGAFHVDKVVVGEYTVQFHADGFRDAQMSVAVSNRSFAPLRVVLADRGASRDGDRGDRGQCSSSEHRDLRESEYQRD